MSKRSVRRAGVAALALAILADGAPAAAQQSIVGKWAIGGKCATPLSVVDIEPLGLSGEDFYCKFSKVTRAGDTVRWSGQCDFSENGDEPTTVMAQLRGRKLFYRFLGMGWNGPFDRCAR